MRYFGNLDRGRIRVTLGPEDYTMHTHVPISYAQHMAKGRTYKPCMGAYVARTWSCPSWAGHPCHTSPEEAPSSAFVSDIGPI